MNGQKISITPVNASFLEACARELENDELLGRIISFQLDPENVSMANVVDRIRIKREFHGDCQSELDFVASHFFEVGLDVLRCLSVSDLELVLTNPLLKLESELRCDCVARWREGRRRRGPAAARRVRVPERVQTR